MGMGYADRQFIVKMIPHHEGAIAMADLALSRARRPEIKAPVPISVVVRSRCLC